MLVHSAFGGGVQGFSPGNYFFMLCAAYCNSGNFHCLVYFCGMCTQ